ncbi:SPW repeat protein [Halovivax ruber XH-70]|uniref:SPW repeat protein n=1 Tax=Halovivax ruber (strain DSM 18193 / JCM 13892 / XH-70) TaxID=797302 RepID=L0IC42_HALRX|nr:SPW repeat protein [Halovivax ruber]AGB15537.1 SPW repeat protein [Halovivax ruber XH-70]
MGDTDTLRADGGAERAGGDTGYGGDAERNVLNTDVLQWVSALAAIVGLWLVASPFLYEATDAAYWNNTLVGTGIFALAGYNFYRLSKDHLASVGVASLAILLGLWAVVSPYLIDMGSSVLSTSTIVSGLAVAALSAYSAYANSRADVPDRAGARV